MFSSEREREREREECLIADCKSAFHFEQIISSEWLKYGQTKDKNACVVRHNKLGLITVRNNGVRPLWLAAWCRPVTSYKLKSYKWKSNKLQPYSRILQLVNGGSDFRAQPEGKCFRWKLATIWRPKRYDTFMILFKNQTCHSFGEWIRQKITKASRLSRIEMAASNTNLAILILNQSNVFRQSLLGHSVFGTGDASWPFGAGEMSVSSPMDNISCQSVPSRCPFICQYRPIGSNWPLLPSDLLDLLC